MSITEVFKQVSGCVVFFLADVALSYKIYNWTQNDERNLENDQKKTKTQLSNVNLVLPKKSVFLNG